jgi:galactokinase
VNLIGDHTDYTGGFVFPMAIQLGTTATFEPGGGRVIFRSDSETGLAELPLKIEKPSSVRPSWARYVAGVIAAIAPAEGGTGHISTTLPAGEGLSSSAALAVAVALALGYEGSREELVFACQRAEQLAVGVPCGVMDQMASVFGKKGHALLIDCSSHSVTPVRLPENCEVVAVPSGEQHNLAESHYAERRRQCVEAESLVGPLRTASLPDLDALDDPVLRRRARHVVSENQRVLAFADRLRTGDLVEAGWLMTASHASLRDDFEVSTPALDHLVSRLLDTPRVYGARLTGAGFGGSVVALTDPGALAEGLRLSPSAGATLM